MFEEFDLEQWVTEQEVEEEKQDMHYSTYMLPKWDLDNESY